MNVRWKVDKWETFLEAYSPGLPGKSKWIIRNFFSVLWITSDIWTPDFLHMNAKNLHTHTVFCILTLASYCDTSRIWDDGQCFGKRKMRSVSNIGDTVAYVKGCKLCQSFHAGHGGVTDTGLVLSALTASSLVPCLWSWLCFIPFVNIFMKLNNNPKE